MSLGLAPTHPLARLLAVVAVLAAAGALLAAPPAQRQASAQDSPVPNYASCIENFFTGPAPGFEGAPAGELYGPTAINAQSANQGLSVAVNDVGTITVFKWPRPSFYDQIKYKTSSREQERLGALENVGSFLGLAVATGDATEPTETVWLRDLPADSTTQTHPDPMSDVIETTYSAPDLGLEITVRDLTARNRDVFSRKVEVTKNEGSPVTAAKLVAYENFNLVTTKHPYGPTQDWCEEEENTDAASYNASADAVIHSTTGEDESTGEVRTVAAGMAFKGESVGHQVGGDAYEGTAAETTPATQDAYNDASDDGQLSGSDAYPLPTAEIAEGQTTGAMTASLDLSSGSDSETVLLAGADSGSALVEKINQARDRSFDDRTSDKAAWFDDLLSEAPLPATDDEKLTRLAKRALVTLVSTYDPNSGAVVASIATQSPYGEDWIRDGAFFNHILDLIGQHDWVDKRNKWYEQLQSREGDETQLGSNNPFAEAFQMAVVPPGNWAMNYYADDVVGGPIPYEIDETGYGLWTFWDHYDATGNVENLRAVYPAIKAAADFLVECKDPQNDLQCTAIEDDNPTPDQTMTGAGPVWLGLKSAAKAARVLGKTADADRWAARRDELGAAIDQELYQNGAYGGSNAPTVWPVCFKDFDSPRLDPSHYEALRDSIASTFRQPTPEDGPSNAGLYESKSLISLAKAKKDQSGWLSFVQDGLSWVADEHAEPGTNVMGEQWLEKDGDVISTTSQPHVWEQILAYLGMLEAFPPEGETLEETNDCGGVVEALRSDVNRLSGDGRLETAVEVSQASRDSAETVVLARAGRYPDALTGAPLATDRDAPLLLTESDQLSQPTADEIERLEASNAMLLGGEVAISNDVANTLEQQGLSVERVGGDDRFGTAAAIAGQLGDSPESAFVAQGVAANPSGGFPDPLSAAPYAAFINRPILLTGPDQVPTTTAATLDELGVSESVVVGGPAAVSDGVVSQLEDGGHGPRRLAGDTRYGTSAAVFDEAVAAGMNPARPWLATGTNFPDALTAGSTVASTGGTLLLVDPTDLANSPPTRQRLQAQQGSLDQVRILGGAQGISGQVERQVRSITGSEG
jgi:putative cell wall-binding protein